MQRDPVSCGLASLCIALNALKVTPLRDFGGNQSDILAGNYELMPVTEKSILGTCLCV